MPEGSAIKSKSKIPELTIATVEEFLDK